jgi:hypothetical protein
VFSRLIFCFVVVLFFLFLFCFGNHGYYIGRPGLVEPIYRDNTVKSVLKHIVRIQGMYRTVHEFTCIEPPNVTPLYQGSNAVHSFGGVFLFGRGLVKDGKKASPCSAIW